MRRRGAGVCAARRAARRGTSQSVDSALAGWIDGGPFAQYLRRVLRSPPPYCAAPAEMIRQNEWSLPYLRLQAHHDLRKSFTDSVTPEGLLRMRWLAAAHPAFIADVREVRFEFTLSDMCEAIDAGGLGARAARWLGARAAPRPGREPDTPELHRHIRWLCRLVEPRLLDKAKPQRLRSARWLRQQYGAAFGMAGTPPAV